MDNGILIFARINDWPVNVFCVRDNASKPPELRLFFDNVMVDVTTLQRGMSELAAKLPRQPYSYFTKNKLSVVRNGVSTFVPVTRDGPLVKVEVFYTGPSSFFRREPPVLETRMTIDGVEADPDVYE